jgi:hypothetical protein
MHRRNAITRSKLSDSFTNLMHNTRVIIALVAGSFCAPILGSFPVNRQLYVPETEKQ